MAEENSEPWRPLSARGKTGTRFEGLHDGIPPWLRPSMYDWAIRFYFWNGRIQDNSVKETQLALRVSHDTKEFESHLASEDNLLLDLVDYQLSKLGIPSAANQGLISTLAKALEKAGSSWRVSTAGNAPHLERRVDATVVQAADQVRSRTKRPGEHLAMAWTAAYGRGADPSKAYREAVRAVEAAAIQAFVPTDKTATLGKVIGHLKANKAGIKSKLTPQGAIVPADVLVGMLGLLWHSQWDRHGVPDDDAGFSVSQAEAEAALHLAATLTQWLTSGAFSL